MRQSSAVALAALALLLLAACGGGSGRDAALTPAADSSAVSRGDGSVTTPDPSSPGTQDPSGRSAELNPAATALMLQTGWGPSPAELNRAATLATRLPLPELAGQVIVARYSGTGAPTDLVNDLHLGGVISFSENVSSAADIGAAVSELRAGVQRDYPLWVSVDQEGGIVQRIEDGVTDYPTFLSAGAADAPGLTRAVAAANGGELAELGFNVDFAPDADVTSGADDPTIGSRSAGSAPQVVARAAVAAAEGFLDSGVVPVLKHFPGHGSVPVDSHVALPVQPATPGELRTRDWLPFQTAIKAGVPAIMTGHIVVEALDPGVPTSMSAKLTRGTLRNQMGFHGVVVTDALDMAAITERYTPGESAVAALRAGADVLLSPSDPAAARDGIVAAVRSGALTRTRLQQAAARQIALLLHNAANPAAGAAPNGAAAVRRLLAQAITSVAGPCQGRLVGPAVNPVLGSGSDQASSDAFVAAADAAGLQISPEGDPVVFIGYGGGPVAAALGAQVAVATDTPYALGASVARVKLATYGDSRPAMDALVAVLLGKAKAPGTLPVAVSGLARTGC